MEARTSLSSGALGQVIGRYILEEAIGVGAMATVYRARDTHLSRAVALKVLHPHLSASEAARARFSREARTAASLTHEFVPPVFDCSSESDEVCYIASELLSGPTLRAFVAMHGALLPEAALAIGLQLCRALSAAHELGIIHRDIKPENALLHDDRCVKLTDFGLAHLRFAPSLTVTGQVLGSPAHMSPEHVNGSLCTEASDIFSMGTVLYYLLAGSLPFEAQTPQELFRKILTGRYRSLDQVDGRIGTRISRIVDRCLRVKAGDRYGSAEALAAALNTELSGMGVVDSDAFCAEYLRAPKVLGESMVRASPERLLRWAVTELDNGQVAGAIAVLNRALAYAPDHREVRRALERIGRRRLGQRIALAAGLALAAAFLVALLIAYAPRYLPFGSHAGEARQDDGLSAADRVSSTNGVRANGAGAEDSARAARAGERGTAPRQANKPAVGRGTVARPRGGGANSRNEGVETKTRPVVFKPTPMNVTIQIDDDPPFAFGPDSRVRSLTVGTHRVVFRGAGGCCEEIVRQIELEAASEPLTLAVVLPPRDARLYVDTNVPASVAIEGMDDVQRALDVVRLPLGQAYQRTISMRISAEGYQAESRSVTVQAGALKRVQVALRPAVQGENDP